MSGAFRRARWVLYGLAISAGLLGLLVSAPAQAQGANSMYLSPAGGAYTVGANINVAVRINTTTAVNAVQADLTYTSNLQFVSINEAGSAFSIPASGSGGGGTVTIARGNFSGVSGDQLVATVVFKVASAGAGTVQVLNSSSALSATDSSNVITTRNGANYELQAPASPAPTPGTPPASSPPPAASPSKTTNSRTVIQSGGNTVAVTPGQPAEQKVELNAPASLESLAVGGTGREITKVEYLLDGKVVSSSSTPPYKYSIDNTDYRNGTYELTSKTYYKDGDIETGKVSLVVDNPFSLKAAWLEIKHYAWLVIILLIIIGELVYLTLFKRLRKSKIAPLSDAEKPVAVIGGQSPAATTPPAPSTIPPNSSPTIPKEPAAVPGVIQPSASSAPPAPAAPVATVPVPAGPAQPEGTDSSVPAPVDDNTAKTADSDDPKLPPTSTPSSRTI